MRATHLVRGTAIALALVVGLAVLGFGDEDRPPVVADYVFAGGKVYTVDADRPWAEAVAVKGNEIVYVGDTEGAKAYIGEGTEFVELGGRMMLPGFVESHMHVTVGAALAQGLWLAHLDTKEEFLTATKEYVAQHPDKSFYLGFGWKPFAFPPEGPTKADLDAITSEKPIFLFDISCHAAWVNTKALEMAGVTKETPDPQPGFSYFQRDAQGEATGYLVEVAAGFGVLNGIQPVTPEFVLQGLGEWMPKFAAAGLTTMVDCGYVFMGDVNTQRTGSDVLRRAEKEGLVKARVYTSYYARSPDWDNIAWYKQMAAWSPDTRFIQHRVLKIGCDGDATSQSIKLYEPFTDTGSHGSAAFPEDKLTELVTAAAGENLHMHFHAMGDATVGDVLTAIEEARRVHPDTTSRFALAHVYLIHPRDFDRFKAVDFVPTFAGNWFAPDPSDVDVKNRMLGDTRFPSWYPMKSLHDRGVVCSLGSDFPASGAIATYKMLDQIQYVMTRQFLSGKGDVWPPDSERVSLEVALKAATWNGAYSLGLEDELGSIEVGKKADLIVLDRNLFEIETAKIHDAQVIFTMVDGDVMHDAFFGLGDIKAGLAAIGLLKEHSEDFDQVVSELLKNRPANTDYQGHRCACDIGTALYEALRNPEQAKETARFVNRLLDVIEHEIVPKTAEGVKTGSKLFGGGIIRKDDLSTVIAETNNEKVWPLYHGEVHALKKYWEIPREQRPKPDELILIATHEPCPLCLSAITWMGIDRFYYLFTYEDSRDEFGIPHDYRMLEEIFKCKHGEYAPENHYWKSAGIRQLIDHCSPGARLALLARVQRIKKKYDEMSAVYQANKGESDIPLK